MSSASENGSSAGAKARPAQRRAGTPPSSAGDTLGNPPPVFDILAWNADGTNLPAALHRQFLEIFQDNVLCQPGAMTVLGTPVDLRQIALLAYVTGGVTDHLTPWQGCYQTTQLLSGPATFVLSNAGHIQSLVNPPATRKRPISSTARPAPIRSNGSPNPRRSPGPGGNTGRTG